MVEHRTQKGDMDKAIGIAAIVIGILVLVGELTFAFLIPILGAILLIAGILILLNILRASNALGVVFLVVGVLLLVNLLNIPGVLARVLDLVVGVVLLVVGIMKLT